MPKDHISPLARLATADAGVTIVQPDWRIELLTALAGALVLFCAALAGEAMAPMPAPVIADATENEVLRARIAHLENSATVRIEPDGVGFHCSHQNVRREWERAIAAECEVLGGMLTSARTTR